MINRHLTQGEIEDVYFPRGASSVTGKMRYLKAPFQLLVFQIEGGGRESFVMPRGLVDDIPQAYGADTPSSKEEMARDDFGYYTGETHVIEESELGDFNGNPRNWRGFHSFSAI